MTSLVLPAALSAPQPFSLGQTLFFWVCAAVMVGLALGVLLCRKAVHCAVCMVGVMLCLAMMYVCQGAYFLGVVQVVVYTGAVMTLILFIIMMVGVSASDNYRRTRTYLRCGAGLMGLVGMVIFALVAWFSYLPTNGKINPITTNAGSTDSNPVIVAMSIFSNHIFTMEVVGCLLIIAAIGAMSLTHSDTLRRIFRQPETAQARLLDYQAHGTHPGQRPAPGVYHDTNAADVPALDGETESGRKDSIMPALRARSAERTLGEVSPSTVAKVRQDLQGDPSKGVHSIAASKAVKLSGAWGMGGIEPDFELQSVRTQVLKPQLFISPSETGSSHSPVLATGEPGTDVPSKAADDEVQGRCTKQTEPDSDEKPLSLPPATDSDTTSENTPVENQKEGTDGTN